MSNKKKEITVIINAIIAMKIAQQRWCESMLDDTEFVQIIKTELDKITSIKIETGLRH